MNIIRAIIALILLNSFAIAQTPPSSDSNLYDTWKIQCVGNSYFATDEIHTGLALDRTARLAGFDEAPTNRYLEIVRSRIVRGYLTAGFRDVQVVTTVDAVTGCLTATIEEGQQWKQRDVLVSGLSLQECEHVGLLMNSGVNDSNPLQKSQPKLTYWKKSNSMTFVMSADAIYRKTVHEALTAIGYPLAEFTITLSESSDDDKHTVDLKIDVTATGATLTVGDITFTGLEKHTTEQMLAFLELKPGMPLTLPMRETIVRKLLDSGRFLMAEVTHEPFYFDPAVPLDLRIRVREYDLAAPLGEELTELQQTLMKTNEWLAKWPELGEDLHVRFSASTEHANDVVKSMIPQEYHVLCNPALGTGNPGNFCVDFMTSPHKGSLITIQVTDPQGTVSLKRTILLTKSEQGFLAWQNKKKWERTNDMSVVFTQSMLGQWGNKDDHRARMTFGYGINSDPEKGFRPEFKTTAAAVIHLLNGMPENMTVLEGDLYRVTWPTGEIELDRNSGAIRSITGKSDQAGLEITCEKGLVEAELSRLQEITKGWKNECQPGRELPALAGMILEDIKLSQLVFEDIQIGETKVGDVDPAKTNVADVYVLLLDLLSNEPFLDRWSKAMALMKESHTFRIPQESHSTGNVSGWLTYLPFVVPHVPAGSFPHRLGLNLFDAQATGDMQLGYRLIADLLQKKDDGAISCYLVARLSPGTAVGTLCAKAGLDRLSRAEFQKDLAPFVAEQSAVREMLCALLVWLQRTNDKEIETLAKLIEQNLKDQNEKPLNIRPLLMLIRSQRDKPAEDVLAALVPIMWEGGLRALIEADLKTLAATPVPTDSKQYFGPAATILNDATKKPTTGNDAANKDLIKTISRATSISDIKLDEEWDLGK